MITPIFLIFFEMWMFLDKAEMLSSVKIHKGLLLFYSIVSEYRPSPNPPDYLLDTTEVFVHLISLLRFF